LLSKLTLRQMLTLPYVVLVVLAAAVIGVLSYRAGSDAVDTLSDHVLTETVGRISQAVDKHVSGSEAVLETAFPADMPAPVSIKGEVEALRTRLWQATTVHLDPNNYAYYGNRSGQFIGLWRFSETEAELRLRTDPDTPRSIYRYSRMSGALKDPFVESRIFDPRDRPWYKAGQSAATQTWTSVYIDFKTLQLVATRARRVANAAGEFEGVVATDLLLEHLNQFLRKLKLSANGFAFIVEPDGNLIATSRGPHIRKGANGNNERLNAAASGDPMLVATYHAVKSLTTDADAKTGFNTAAFKGPDGKTIQAGYARLRDKAGLDWTVAVAVPRSDFMQKVTDNVRQTVALALLACLLIGATGFMVLNVIADNLRRLAAAARQFGDGVIDAKIPVDRADEIGELAKSFAGMQKQLLTDRLTGIANRESVVRRIEDRIVRQRRRGDSRPFAILFVDLNGFKHINDYLGHDVGDAVLSEIAVRLAGNVREEDLAARFGGDEFVVVLENVANRVDAMSARDKLERALAAPLKSLEGLAVDKLPPGIGAAIGVAVCPDDGHDLETLIKRADYDMYQRKPGDTGTDPTKTGAA
jgi:diguanylate cyclase (GGDEF)-like protein